MTDPMVLCIRVWPSCVPEEAKAVMAEEFGLNVAYRHINPRSCSDLINLIAQHRPVAVYTPLLLTGATRATCRIHNISVVACREGTLEIWISDGEGLLKSCAPQKIPASAANS